jgi:hypothetical protein
LSKMVSSLTKLQFESWSRRHFPCFFDLSLKNVLSSKSPKSALSVNTQT